MNVIKIFKAKWIYKAFRYMNDSAKMKNLAEEAMNFSGKKGLEGVVDSVKILGQYIKAVANGSYKDYSKSKLALAVAALIYLVVPTDCVPDFIPFTGFLDDITVISFAFKQMHDEITKFKAAIAPKDELAKTEEVVFDEAEEIVENADGLDS